MKSGFVLGHFLHVVFRAPAGVACGRPIDRERACCAIALASLEPLDLEGFSEAFKAGFGHPCVKMEAE